MSLKITLTTEARLSEGQFLLDGQTFNIEVSGIDSRNSYTNSFQRRRAEYTAKINFNKEQ
jgi:hypothetical protein